MVEEGNEFCSNCGAKLSPAIVNEAPPIPQPSPTPVASTKSPRTSKTTGHSKMTRLLGVASIVVLILAIIVSGVGWYSIGMSFLQTGTALSSRFQSGISGSGLIENTSTGETLVLPITDGGVFPISVSVDGALLDSQNVSLLSIDSSVSVNPHQTRSLVVQIPTSVYEQLHTGNSTSINSGTLQARAEVTTLDGLIGARLSLSLGLASSNGTAGGPLP